MVRCHVAARSTTVGLLGYGTVGSAVHRLLAESAQEIERVTGSAGPRRSRRWSATRPATRAAPDGLLTTDFADSPRRSRRSRWWPR